MSDAVAQPYPAFVPQRLCPACFLVQEEVVCARCDRETAVYSDLCLGPLVVGRWRLLAGDPTLIDLAAGSCEGPRRYPRPLQQHGVPDIVSRQHEGTTVWLWESSWVDIAQVAADREPELFDRVMRALHASTCLLLQVPEDEPGFRARYAHAHGRGPLPDLASLLDGLELSVEYTGADLQFLAIIVSDRLDEAHMPHFERLRRRFPGIKVEFFSSEVDAMAGCLRSRNISQSSARRHPVQQGDRLEIDVLDMGGQLARELIARLHRVGHERERTAGSGGWRKRLFAGKMHGVRLLRTLVDNEAVMRDARCPGTVDLPLAILPAVSWRGEFAAGFFERMQVRLSYGDGSADQEDRPCLIGLGANRLRGEQRLSELLDRGWATRTTPVVLLTNELETDPVLRNWAKQELANVTELLFAPVDALSCVQQLVAQLTSSRW